MTKESIDCKGQDQPKRRSGAQKDYTGDIGPAWRKSCGMGAIVGKRT